MSSILLADDNPHAQRMGSQILSQEGHTVITVSDGDEAMLHLEENVPDLVMVDTRMPGPSGFDICKHIKAQAKFKAVKVVLLAGPLEPFDTAEAESAGPDGVLHKPLDAYTLIDTVNSLLGQVPEAADHGEGGAAKAAATDGAAPRNDKPVEVGAPNVPEPAKPQAAPAPRPVASPALATARETAPAATATATTTKPAPAKTASAAAQRPATAVAELSDALSHHFTSVVEQALGTEDAQHRQRQQVETIVREVLEEVLPSIIERITDRVMASIERY